MFFSNVSAYIKRNKVCLALLMVTCVFMANSFADTEVDHATALLGSWYVDNTSKTFPDASGGTTCRYYRHNDYTLSQPANLPYDPPYSWGQPNPNYWYYVILVNSNIPNMWLAQWTDEKSGNWDCASMMSKDPPHDTACWNTPTTPPCAVKAYQYAMAH